MTLSTAHCSRSIVVVVCYAVIFIGTTLPAPTQPITNTIRSDATWRAISPAPSAGWNTDLAFDDSDAAGWESAFKSPAGDHIWYRSNLSGDAPNQAWFRYTFSLSDGATSATGRFFFDDDGEAYINGTLVVDDRGGGASTFNLQLDPNLFHVGQNLIAVHGIDRSAPFNNIGVNISITTVPEPSGLWLLALITLFVPIGLSPGTKYLRRLA